MTVAAAGDRVFVGGGGALGTAVYRETGLTPTNGGAAVGGAITAISFSGTTATVTTTSAHGMAAGQYVFITGVVGCSGVNGVHQLATASGSSYTFVSAAAGGTWASGGATEQLIAYLADRDGSQTGDAGEVVLSQYLISDLSTLLEASTFALNGVSGLLFAGFTVYGGDLANNAIGTFIDARTANSRFIAVQDCTVETLGTGGLCFISLIPVVDVANHWLIERCRFRSTNVGGTAEVLYIIAPTTATASDYNLDITLRNCVSETAASTVFANSSGANGFKGGGVLVDHGTIRQMSTASPLDVFAAGWSVVYPLVVTNCSIEAYNTTFTVTSLGQVVEEYNHYPTAVATNSVAGGASITGTLAVPAAMSQLGQELTQGRRARAHGTPAAFSTLGAFGDTELAVGAFATITDDATVGTPSWTNPGNATYPDTNLATCVLTTGQDSHYLNFQGVAYDRPIPANATIDGVRVELFEKGSAGSALTVSGTVAGVQLIKGGTVTGSRKQNTTIWTTTEAIEVFGGPADLWGTTLSPSDVNGATFGFVVSVHSTGSVTADVDYARIIVYYHLPVPSCNTDLLNRPRPAGANTLGAAGTATSGGSATLTDSGAAWGVNQWAGWCLAITGGTGSGQTKIIKSNTATALTFFSNWPTTPDSTSVYVLYYAGANACESFKATSATGTTVTCSNASWDTRNQWGGYTLEVLSGTGSGQRAVILSHNATVITLGPTGTNWVTTPDSTSVCAIYRGVIGRTGVGAALGALERHDTAFMDTAHADSGSCYGITGPGDQDLAIAVDATTYTVTVKVRTDGSSGFASGFEPQAQILANAAIGVTAQTVTASSPGTSYQTLTFSAITPTAKGVITLRLINRTGTAYASCYFDTVSGI